MRSEDLRRMNSVLRHRLRNHASGMRTATDFLASSMQDRLKPEELEYFPLIRQECGDLVSLVDRLNLWFEDVPTAASAEVASVLAAVATDARTRLPRATLVLPEVNASARRIVVRPDHLRIVLFELVANATEAAMHKPAFVEVSVESDRLLVAVVDQGAAPTKANIEDWLRPFFTTKPRHLGLGLAIARRLLQDVGAEVAISPIAGGGMRAEVVWPLAVTGGETRRAKAG